ncbi:MAG: hypothetical protein WBV23_13420, partial [Desulfobaccales bacterium]
MQEVLYPPKVGRQPPEGRQYPHSRLPAPGIMEKSRDLFPGHVGHGPEAQKSQPLSRGHLRQGRGFQVQNRLGQPGQWYSLTLFMDNAGGGDQAPGDRGKPP